MSRTDSNEKNKDFYLILKQEALKVMSVFKSY